MRATSVRRICLRLTRFPFLFGGTFIEGNFVYQHIMCPANYFPSFSEGLSLRAMIPRHLKALSAAGFPFLFGGTFIEGLGCAGVAAEVDFCNFPSVSEGLSLRPPSVAGTRGGVQFPLLSGGTFIEATERHWQRPPSSRFPFLLGRAFIEAFESAPPDRTQNANSLPIWRGLH